MQNNLSGQTNSIRRQPHKTASSKPLGLSTLTWPEKNLCAHFVNIFVDIYIFAIRNVHSRMNMPGGVRYIGAHVCGSRFSFRDKWLSPKSIPRDADFARASLLVSRRVLDAVINIFNFANGWGRRMMRNVVRQ